VDGGCPVPVDQTSPKAHSKRTGHVNIAHWPRATTADCPREISPAFRSMRDASTLWFHTALHPVNQSGERVGYNLEVRELESREPAVTEGAARRLPWRAGPGPAPRLSERAPLGASMLRAPVPIDALAFHSHGLLRWQLFAVRRRILHAPSLNLTGNVGSILCGSWRNPMENQLRLSMDQRSILSKECSQPSSLETGQPASPDNTRKGTSENCAVLHLYSYSKRLQLFVEPGKEGSM
jgi:hypothetical protein